MNDVSKNSPNTNTFSDLLKPGALLSRLDELGFSTPTDIQVLALPRALDHKDLIIKAKTGSGKTLAFVIPLLDRFEKLGTDKSTTVALFIAPTRELAIQIHEVILQLQPELEPVLVIGGVEERKQKTALEKDARIIVGTPGRLLDLLQRKIYSLKTCRYFVLDEADEMLSMGFIEDVRAILSRLPKERQGLFVSATISPRVEMLAHSFLTKSEYVFVDALDDEKPKIEHLYCEVSGDLLAKPHALCDIIETQRPRSAIIFCNTKSDTQFVEVLLRRRGFDARRMNSDLSQSQRQAVIAKIKSEELQLLVATDIAARGIDIQELDLVVNYTLHDQPDTYVHRSGRTGRAGLKGRAISLVGPRDYGAFHFLKKALDIQFEKMTLPTDEEVADARLAHVYEMLRENASRLDTRGQLSAKKLLRDHACLEQASEDLIEVIGRLCEFTLAHSIAEETKSLDEELEATSREKEDSPRGERSRDEGGKGDRRRNDRQRNGKDRDESGSGREDRRSRPERTSERLDASQASDSRAPRSTPEEATPEIERVRLFVGQGSQQGMTEATFTALAKDLAEVEAKELNRFSVREHYSYVDTSLASAEKLLESVAGIDHNGASLPIEIASKFEAPRRRNYEQGEEGRGGRSNDRSNRRREGSKGGGRQGQGRQGQGRQGQGRQGQGQRRDR